MTKEKPVLMLVEWYDAVGGTTEWEDVDLQTFKTALIRSVGWTVEVDGDLIVTPHLAEDGMSCGSIIIPGGTIHRKFALKHNNRPVK